MWRDSYLIGDDRIDTQHRELFRNAKVLMDSLKDVNTAKHKQFLIEALDFLKSYVATHFRDEENLASSVGYADAQRHKRLHDDLIIDVMFYERELIYSDFSQASTERFLGFLSAWLINHVMDEDQRITHGIIKANSVENAEEFLNEFAEKAIQSIATLAGIPNHTIGCEIGSLRRLDPVAYFRTNMLGQPRLGVEFSYSKEIAVNIFKSIAGISQQEPNDATYSILSELSNTMGGKFAEILTASGAPCTSERSVQYFFTANENNIRRRIYISTEIGDAEIVIFVKN